MGLQVAQAAITEFVTSWLEGAAIGAAGGAALGTAANSIDGFLLAFVGGVALGALAGATRDVVKVGFAANRAHPRGWHIAKLEQPLLRPSLAAG